MSDPVVEVQQLNLSYDDTPALSDVSFSLPAASLVGIVGPNGAGKSTLVKAIVGSKKPDSGTIRLFGKAANKGRSELTYVPQRGAVDWDFPITAEQVVWQGRYQSAGLLGRFKKEDRQAVADALEAVSISDLANRQIGALSGGQRQRVFLARALAQGGQLFVLDEPFAGVDAATESAIVDVLRSLRDQGKTVLVVHHDLSTVGEYFDHVVLLNRRLVACGPTAEAFTADQVQETYGGRVAIFADDGDGKLVV